MSITLWDNLHDGVIEHLEGRVPGDLVLSVRIEYLRKLFSDDGKNIIVRLKDCTELMYEPETTLEMLKEFTAVWEELEHEGILGGSAAGDFTRVFCMNGSIYLKYSDYELTLDTGVPITIEQLQEKGRIYWDNFGKRAEAHPVE